MNNFISRTITGISFIIFIIGSILLSQYLFFLLFLLITILGILEFYNLSVKDNIRPQKFVGIILGAVLFISTALFSQDLINYKILLINIPLLFLIFIIELYRKTEKPFTNISFTLLGIIYIALPFSLLNFFFNPGFISDKYFISIILGYFFLIWISDTAAYLFGTILGKHQLFKRISPEKSWEGFIGGAICCMTMAYINSLYFTEFNIIQWLVIASIVIVAGIFGDLIESLFKRSINCKDSGTIFPGHGGILDRFDALLIATPFVFIYIMIIS